MLPIHINMKNIAILLSIILCFHHSYEIENDEIKEILKLTIHSKSIDSVKFDTKFNQNDEVFILADDLVREIIDVKSQEGIKLGEKILYFFPEEYLFTFEISKYIEIKEFELDNYQAKLVVAVVEEKVWTKKEEKFRLTLNFKKVDRNWKIKTIN